MEQTQLLDQLALFSALSVKAYLTSREQLYHADQLATALGTDRWPSAPPLISMEHGFPLASSSHAIPPINRCRTWMMWDYDDQNLDDEDIDDEE
jgi:hypothetical protein